MPPMAPFADLALGDHVCLPVSSEGEKLRFAADFAAAGLARQEKVLLCSDEPEPVREAVWRAVADAGTAEAQGQLAVLPCDEVQLAGGGFHPTRLIEVWTEVIERTSKEGYAGLRVAVDMAWALRAPTLADVFAFEARANSLFLDRRMSAVCIYDRRMYGADAMARASTAHPINPDQARLRCARTDDGFLILTGEADATNHVALAAVLATVSEGDSPLVIDASELAFADLGAVRLLGEMIARRPGPTRVLGASWVTWLLDVVTAGTVR